MCIGTEEILWGVICVHVCMYISSVGMFFITSGDLCVCGGHGTFYKVYMYVWVYQYF